jgi:hypothetical protein
MWLYFHASTYLYGMAWILGIWAHLFTVYKICFNFYSHNFVGRKPEWKRPFGIPRCRWLDNIRVDLRELGWEGVDWIHVAHDRNMVMNIWVL